jgi:hypothetical protein
MRWYFKLMTDSGLVFDCTIILIFVLVTIGVMQYAKYCDTQDYNERVSRRRYNYETVTREKDLENDRNTWF